MKNKKTKKPAGINNLDLGYINDFKTEGLEHIISVAYQELWQLLEDAEQEFDTTADFQNGKVATVSLDLTKAQLRALNESVGLTCAILKTEYC